MPKNLFQSTECVTYQGIPIWREDGETKAFCVDFDGMKYEQFYTYSQARNAIDHFLGYL